ncbi:hypothetical protein CC80DRAFT_318246 [Byssothecium circinans]|uniref:Uncharacterized protein n=1 Tax=Byssothecium circinans TaxID=147558 RepID=A0A6A5T5Q6_9PLEO|nr:hypothetical protein CC80DRAFT_329633 [Byssothecium circinans]KAF1948285.1 hypothetical protein CC80DRAFT_318246 [Byssothecium circinans]
MPPCFVEGKNSNGLVSFLLRIPLTPISPYFTHYSCDRFTSPASYCVCIPSLRYFLLLSTPQDPSTRRTSFNGEPRHPATSHSMDHRMPSAKIKSPPLSTPDTDKSLASETWGLVGHDEDRDVQENYNVDSRADEETRSVFDILRGSAVHLESALAELSVWVGVW